MIDHDDDGVFDAFGHLAVVLHGFFGRLVAEKADMAHMRIGHELEQAVDHADASAQNGHDGEEMLFEHGKVPHADGRFDGGGYRFEITRDLVAHEQRDLVQQHAEILGARIGTTHVRQLVGD